jgi:hypothetical protein
MSFMESNPTVKCANSSSYSPEARHSRHAPLLAELERIFVTHQVNGQVTVAYDTNLYYGQLS